MQEAIRGRRNGLKTACAFTGRPDIDTAEQNAAISYLFDTVRRRFKDYDRQYEKLESICNEPDGPLMYAAQYSLTMQGIRQILVHRVMKNWCVKCACVF